MDTPIRKIIDSDVAGWFAIIRKGKRAHTFNRYRLFCFQLFKLAELDGLLAKGKSPYDSKLIPKARADPIVRLTPTTGEFAKIIDEIVSQRSYPKRSSTAGSGD